VNQIPTVLVRKANKKLRSGDIVMYQRSSDLVIHRLLTKDEDGWNYTLGDNQIHIDPPVYADDMYGRVIKIIKGKRVINLNRTEWVAINRTIGWCGNWEISLQWLFERIKSNQFIKDYGENSIEKNRTIVEGQSNKSKFSMNRLLWFPYRFLTRILIRAFIH